MINIPNTVLERPDVTRNNSDEGLTDIQHLQARPDLGSVQSDDPALFTSTIQVTPPESIKRLGIGWRRWFAESIYSPTGNKVEFCFQGPTHLLVLYHEGARRDGETSIDGLRPSIARSFVNKLTFVPAGHAYREWHETSTPTRMTFLYIDPMEFLRPDGTCDSYAPRLYGDDPVVCETAAKIRNAIESCEPKNYPYLEALSSVLAYELTRPSDVGRQHSANRGGLASWQKHAVTRHIEEHLSEQICLDTLARLVRLSKHHFCRSFKQSFGTPPHLYQVHRRMECAKVLLADRDVSVTEIGFIVGYSQTSSFSVAFRKVTGLAPTQYRRAFR
jgi:AraC family transcriptional regulator